MLPASDCIPGASSRSPAGLSPEIAFFKKWEEATEDYPKAHAGDVGGADFFVKPLVTPLQTSQTAGIAALCRIMNCKSDIWPANHEGYQMTE